MTGHPAQAIVYVPAGRATQPLCGEAGEAGDFGDALLQKRLQVTAAGTCIHRLRYGLIPTMHSRTMKKTNYS